MTTIYFVRHAQSDHRHADDRTRPLTEAGLAAGVISMLLGGISLEKLGVGPTLVVCEALVAAGVLIVWLGVRKGKRTA